MIAVALSFPPVVIVYVAVLTHSFGVLHSVCVFAIGDGPFAAKSVVAVVAHPFGEVLRLDVRTSSNFAALSPSHDLQSLQGLI